jgi:hypothetical protein
MLAQLERLRDAFGGAATPAKHSLLRRLARARLDSPRAIERLHEVLCFLRAYPDDAAVLAQVESMLSGFARRADLHRHRASLADSGIAGTVIHDRFFHPQAAWIARRWPALLRLDRRDAAADPLIARALPLLVTPHEAIALRELAPGGFAGLDRLCRRGRRGGAPAITDASFLVERIESLPGDSRTREAFGDAIVASFTLLPGADTPSRTLAHFAASPRAFQRAPLRRGRPDLAAELVHRPRRIVRLSVRDGVALVDLARAAMATRARALEAFSYGNPHDAWRVDDGEPRDHSGRGPGALAFAFAGMVPERRHPVAAIYGGLVLRNGVPIGYLQGDVVGRTAALSFNTFETFRGGESAYVFARLLAALRHLFGCTAFSIEPYQLGHGNDEGLASGAWWFYRKLGFAPRDAGALRLAHEEAARVARDPRHRSSPATLGRLARHHLFFDTDPARPQPLPPLVPLGLRVADLLAAGGQADRATALRACSRDAMRLCGLNSLAGFTAGERAAWETWSPLVTLLGARDWRPAERAALVAVIRAKGARSERDYVARWLAHPRLDAAMRMFGQRRRPGSERP